MNNTTKIYYISTVTILLSQLDNKPAISFGIQIEISYTIAHHKMEKCYDDYW